MGQRLFTGYSVKFAAIDKESRKLNESNDCGVKAVAIVSGRPYKDVHAMFKAAGRKDRHGTRLHLIPRVMRQLGFRLVTVQASHFIKKYPKAKQKGKSQVTSYQPRRFPKAWKDGYKYLLYNFHHMWAVVDGECIDWSAGTPLRAEKIWRVVER